ncbi:MAG: PEP-CTERM sorting domain-containing protein [Verrucomicrobiota bacterium]
MRSTFVIATILLLAWATRAVGQTTAYSNLSTSSANPIRDFTDILSMAQSFTPSVSGSISSLSLNLSTRNPGRPVYDVQLWSNSGGATPLPTTLLATFINDYNWNKDVVEPADSSHVVTFASSAFSQNYSLTAGTTYWLVIATTDGVNKRWGVSATSAGPSAAYYLSTGTWGPLSLSGALGAQVLVTAIPEPGTFAMMGGLAVFGFAAYRRRRAVRSSITARL